MALVKTIILTAFLALSGYARVQQDTIPAFFEDIKNKSAEEINLYFDSLRDNDIENKEQLHLRLLNYSQSKSWPYVEALCHRNLGHIYFRQSETVKAVSHLKEGVDLARNIDNEPLLGEILISLAGVYNSINRKEDALKCYLEGYPLILKVDKLWAAKIQRELSTLSYGSENYKDAIKYGLRAIEILNTQPFDSLPRTYQEAYMNVLNTIGITHRQLKHYDSAIYYLQRSEELALRLNNEFWRGLALGNMGSVYLLSGDFDKALPLLKQDMYTSKKFKEWLSARNTALFIGEAYHGKGQLELAKIYYDSALQLDSNSTVPDKVRMLYYKDISKWYADKKEFEKAYYYQGRFNSLNDTIQNREQQLELSRIKTNYDFDSKLNEIELLTRNNELQQQKIEYRNIIIIASAFSFVIILLIAIMLYKSLNARKRDNALLASQKSRIESQSQQLTEQNKVIQAINDNLELEVSKRTQSLKQLNKELDIFLYRASHDIRQPIATILGLENLAMKNAGPNQELREILNKIKHTARSMDNMLRKLQMSYEVNHSPEKAEQLEICQFTQRIIALNKEEIVSHGIDLQMALTPHHIKTDPDLFKIILQNIIENAIYYGNEENPRVEVVGQLAEKEYIIKISDNGSGIAKRFQPSVFNAFFRGHAKSKGNGLGLYLAWKAAFMLHMQLELKSEPNRGTDLILHIPEL